MGSYWIESRVFLIKLSLLTKDEILNLSKAEFKQTLKAAAVKLYEDKEAEFPEPEQIREIERIVLLKVIDRKWMDHIDDMDQLKQKYTYGLWTERSCCRI